MGPNEVDLTFTHKDNTQWEKLTMGVEDKGEYNMVFLIKCKSNTFILAS